MAPASSRAVEPAAAASQAAPSGDDIAARIAQEAFDLAMNKKDSVKDFAVLASLALRARDQSLAERRAADERNAQTAKPLREVTLADYRAVFGIPDPEDEEDTSDPARQTQADAPAPLTLPAPADLSEPGSESAARRI